MTKPASPWEILGFWFSQDEAAYWQKNKDFDNEIAEKFGPTLEMAKRGELDEWCGDRNNTMALTIILDQFSRNIYRNTPEMFAADEHARTVAKYAITCDYISQFEDPDHRRWFIMPFMHSELMADQKYCVAMCKRHKLDSTLPHAIEHMQIIKEFDRFPHRNAILGRQSTGAEQDFLEDGGFAG